MKCKLKRSYENKSTALEAILKIMNKTGIVQYAEMCDRCGKWHTYRFCAVPCR